MSILILFCIVLVFSHQFNMSLFIIDLHFLESVLELFNLLWVQITLNLFLMGKVSLSLSEVTLVVLVASNLLLQTFLVLGSVLVLISLSLSD